MLKKIIAPVVIGSIVVLYYLIFAIVIFFITMAFWVQLLLALVPLLLGGSMIYVVYTRIREIKGGEEDDLSKY